MKKDPIRRGFLGVHWTRWPWPSLVAADIYRQYAKRPMSPMNPGRMRKLRLLRGSYFLIAFTIFGYVIFHTAPEMQTGHRGAQIAARMYDPETLESRKMTYINISGFTVTKEDVTEEAKKASVEYRKKEEK